MNNHPTPEPETLDSSAATLANLPHWLESGLTFAVSTPWIGAETIGAAIGVSEGGREVGSDDMSEPDLADRPTSSGPSPFASTIVVVAAPEGSASYVAALTAGTTAGGGDAATDIDPWDVHALACCWPLGRSADVHFTTDIPQKVIAGALRIYLQIQPDELLLAIVDRSGGRYPAGGCALTTRRFHWAGRPRSPSYTSPLVDEEGQPCPPLGRSIAYADLSEVSSGGILLSGIAPEAGGRLAFGPRGIRVPEELVGVLKNLNRAARGEPAPTSPAADELARRDLPKVIHRSAGARAVQGRMRSFPELLRASTPRVVATPVLAALCVATFAMMVASGAWPSTPYATPDARAVWYWGASFGPSVLLDGERWRLLTSMFLHFGFLHLVFNMWCLLWFGPLVERLFGTLGFVALYLLSGLGGAIASLWYHPMVISAGASGAIFGIFGGLIGYLVIRRDVSPRSVLQLFRPGVIVYLAVDSLLGLAIPGIDGAAHVGGFTTGCLCGLVLHRPWPPPPANSGMLRRLVAACLVAFGLALVYVTTAAGIRARVERDPQIASFLHARQKAAYDYNSFAKAIQPAGREFDDIAKEFEEVVNRMNRPSLLEETITRELDRLISRADANETRLGAVTIDDPDLRNARDHLSSAQRHHVRALKSLRSFLKQEDQQLLHGPEGYEAQIDAGSKDVSSFQKQCSAYLKAHELTIQSP